jgi:hypothetical protein
MKRIFLFLIALASICFAGTAIKKTGSIVEHNFIRTTVWDFDTAGTFTRTGAAAGTNTDTLQLWGLDTLTPFSTTTLRGYRGTAQVGIDVIPDSIKYCVLAHDDAADAITLRTEFQYRQNKKGNWVTFGGNGDIALAGAGVPVWSCFSRQFFPTLDYRIICHPSTTTDSAVVNQVIAFPIRK